MKGSKILLESLKKEKVDIVFGYPGGVVIPLFDELYDDKDIKMYLVRHEQGAAHMADGYARSTGRAGVCLSTSGPGATNLVTGIATAYMDSIPMVALTGQVPTSLIGNDAFQEADITGITRPIVKHNYIIKSTEEIPQVIKNAFHIAQTGRPGPVVIDLPKDVLTGDEDFNYPSELSLRGYKPKYEGHKVQVKKAVELIEQAERPLIYAGGGVIACNGGKTLEELAGKIGAPVTLTLMGLGALASDHPLNVGMLGMHGTRTANYATQETDLLISIGARFDDRVTGKVADFAPHAKIIHIDIDPASVGKIVKVDVPVVGCADNIMKQIISKVKKLEHTPWLKQIDEWKKEYPLTFVDSDNEIKPQYVVRKLSEMAPEGTIVATEVGQNQMWAAQFYKLSGPRKFLTSGGLGTMGYGFPAAIGAQAAFPDNMVIDIAGDGSIQMNIQELAMAVKYNFPVKVAILNNGWLGMVRQWQELFFDKRYSQTDVAGSVDFKKLAEAYGAKGIAVTKKEEVENAIKEAFSHKGPVIMDFRVAREENVWPMVPAGAPLGKMIEGGLA